MSWELSRRRWMRSIKSRVIYGRFRLHTIVILVEMAIIARLTSRFNAYYNDRPLITMMVTNAILCGIADTVAQTISAVRAASASRKPKVDGEPRPFRNGGDIEFQDLDRKGNLLNFAASSASAAAANSRSRSSSAISSQLPLPPQQQQQQQQKQPAEFDFERLTRFMAYGFAMAPLQFRWFKFLERAFPITPASAFAPAMKRVAMDQLVFAPFGVAVFFTVMTVAEGGGRHAVAQKLRDMYVPTVKANYVVWPAVQIINFRLMPVQFQLPFQSTVGIAWTAYLSLSNASVDEQHPVRPKRTDAILPVTTKG